MVGRSSAAFRLLEERLSQPTARTTRAEVDLEAVSDNLKAMRAAAGRASIYAVVKADAYGHGLVPVARRLEQAGADGFCVALAEEGFELREAGIRAPVLVLNSAYGDEHEHVLRARLTPVVFDAANAAAFWRAARGRPVGVHLKVDTGMSRLGVPLVELADLLDKLERMPGLRIDGLMTHLSSADSDPGVTREQIERFDEARALLSARGHRPALFHAANSAAMLAFPEARFNLVRPGIALYGCCPLPDLDAGLKPALRLVSEVISLRRVPAGTGVGYNRTHVAPKQSVIATVAIGYGDALMRAASNRGFLLVRGKRCPIVGNVSMDLTTLDVSGVAGCAVGDEAVLIGEQQGERLRAEDLAHACNTIVYEVLTGISPRVPRFYSRESLRP
jgi:alanine racemase